MKSEPLFLCSSSAQAGGQNAHKVGVNNIAVVLRISFEPKLRRELIADLVEKSMEPCRKVMKDAGLQSTQINEVILVG